MFFIHLTTTVNPAAQSIVYFLYTQIIANVLINYTNNFKYTGIIPLEREKYMKQRVYITS